MTHVHGMYNAMSRWIVQCRVYIPSTKLFAQGIYSLGVPWLYMSSISTQYTFAVKTKCFLLYRLLMKYLGLTWFSFGCQLIFWISSRKPADVWDIVSGSMMSALACRKQNLYCFVYKDVLLGNPCQWPDFMVNYKKCQNDNCWRCGSSEKMLWMWLCRNDKELRAFYACN